VDMIQEQNRAYEESLLADREKVEMHVHVSSHRSGNEGSA
jgi:hypothetical protein